MPLSIGVADVRAVRQAAHDEKLRQNTFQFPSIRKDTGMKLQAPDSSSPARRCVGASAASEQLLCSEMELVRGGREPREVMLNARDASLDFIYTEFALMFPDKADAAELRVALAAGLWAFYPVAGRVAKG